MAPGELDGLVNDLIAEFEHAPENDPALVAEYKSFLTDFAHDWRAVWLQYGDRGAGRPYYEALIKRVQDKLHPDRAALITSTNKIGVNPIIVQRILRAALANSPR